MFKRTVGEAPAPWGEDPMATVQRWFILRAFCLPLANVLFGLQFEEVQCLHFCFTWMGYQRSFRPSSPSCCLRGAALEETGKMRRPMSPTCTLLGMPPRAMTAQFSNSNGGIGYLTRYPFGDSRSRICGFTWPFRKATPCEEFSSTFSFPH